MRAHPNVGGCGFFFVSDEVKTGLIISVHSIISFRGKYILVLNMILCIGHIFVHIRSLLLYQNIIFHSDGNR